MPRSNVNSAAASGANRGDTALPKATGTSGAGCRRSVADPNTERPILRKLVIAWPPPDNILAAMRAEFSDVDIVLASDDDFAEKLPGAQAAVSWAIFPDQLAVA